MKSPKPHRFETLAVHAGHGVDPSTGAVVDPIHLSTTFERDPDGSYPHGYVYSRKSSNGWTFDSSNPNAIVDSTFMQQTPSIKVVVSSVQKDRCVANIMPGWQLGDVIEGDQVIPAHPAS